MWLAQAKGPGRNKEQLREGGNNILGQRVNKWTEQEKARLRITCPLVSLVMTCIQTDISTDDGNN